MQNSGQNAYVGIYYWNSGSPELMLFKRSRGSWAQIGSVYSTAPLAAGTQLELTAVGSTISFLQNGAQVISATDSSITGGRAGHHGLRQRRGRQLVRRRRRESSYTVGGTVSGLSGTVVLQDNGGDNLSVSRQRLVHVRHSLAAGAAYDVTVKTNPSGQTCTVANGPARWLRPT